jgi:DNA-binding response OmpR family regulator
MVPQKDITILWADDEIDLLRPHILFLESKGYRVITVTNATDALQEALKNKIDIVFLDENMPGKSGLEILLPLKQSLPTVPIVMITKSEEENLMDNAIGSKIDDYLIKPINPNQILLSIKKHVENRQLVINKTTLSYQSQFNEISTLINTARNFDDWVNIYRNIVYWELQLEKTQEDLMEILHQQKDEANNEFSKYVKNNYFNWFDPKNNQKPLLSPMVFSKKIFPLIDQGEKVFVIVVDNFCYDQWRYILPSITDFCKVESEEVYCSILPTSTQYARNALFSGLMPMEIQQIFPDLWIDDEEEESKNVNEDELLSYQLKRHAYTISHHYEKINNYKYAQRFLDRFSSFRNQQLIVAVFNFVDILSHARTQAEVIKELVVDEAAYRAVTLSWFQHSFVFDVMAQALNYGFKIILTTDHGSIKVSNPIKVIGDRQTTTNLRYKNGKNLNYDKRLVFEVKDPSIIHLPSNNLVSTYIFASNADYFVYPNNYNQFVTYYKNTLQHGGISMNEMIIPLCTLSAK